MDSYGLHPGFDVSSLGSDYRTSNQRVSITDGSCLSINVGMSASVEELVSLHDVNAYL
jgi:hypothetical protein